MQHIRISSVRDLLSGLAVEHDAGRLGSTILSLVASVLAAYAIERIRFRTACGLGDLRRLSRAASILFIPLAVMVFGFPGSTTEILALILTYPTFLIPLCTWLLMGYRSIPYELEECARRIRNSAGRSSTRIMPLAVPGPISAGSSPSRCPGTSSSTHHLHPVLREQDPCPVLTELVRGDVYEWGALMAGALLGSIPVVVLYSFFVDYYVSSMTGAVKEEDGAVRTLTVRAPRPPHCAKTPVRLEGHPS